MKNLLFVNIACFVILIILFSIAPTFGLFFIGVCGFVQIVLSILISFFGRNNTTRSNSIVHLIVSCLVLFLFYMFTNTGQQLLVWIVVSICFILYVYSLLISYMNFKDYDHV